MPLKLTFPSQFLPLIAPAYTKASMFLPACVELCGVGRQAHAAAAAADE